MRRPLARAIAYSAARTEGADGAALAAAYARALGDGASDLALLACAWIAYKYEHVHPPTWEHVWEMYPGSWGLADLRRAERETLHALGWRLTRRTVPQAVVEAMEARAAATPSSTAAPRASPGEFATPPPPPPPAGALASSLLLLPATPSPSAASPMRLDATGARIVLDAFVSDVLHALVLAEVEHVRTASQWAQEVQDARTGVRVGAALQLAVLRVARLRMPAAVALLRRLRRRILVKRLR